MEDFKKTLAAIDASKEINEEVKTYLKLVETQAHKDKPSSKLIKANLTNAAGILDEYITETLNKPSRVVTDWVKALFLQKVDYKADKNIPETAVPEPKEIPAIPVQGQAEVAEEQPVKPDPANEKLERNYQKTEKLTDSGKFRQALVNYDKLLLRAKKVGNKDIETRIYLDKAYVYDIRKDYPAALDNYHRAAKVSAETGNQKTQAICHYNMASIYDEFGKTDLALNHYYAALSLDGQTENMKAQTHTLNDVGNVFTSMRKYRQAVDHYQVGVSLTKETNDLKGRSFLLSNIGSVFKDTGKDDRALKFYKKSIEYDIKTGNLEGYAINYEHSGDIMSRNSRIKKAQSLYKKSLSASQKLDDRELSARVLEKLNRNNLSY